MFDNFGFDPDCTIKSDKSDIPEPTDMVENWVEVPVSTVYHLIVPNYDAPSEMPIFDNFEEKIPDVGNVLGDGDYPSTVEMTEEGPGVDSALFVRDAGKTVKVFIAG